MAKNKTAQYVQKQGKLAPLLRAAGNILPWTWGESSDASGSSQNPSRSAGPTGSDDVQSLRARAKSTAAIADGPRRERQAAIHGSEADDE